MVSKSQIKLIKSLAQKKYRHRNKLFIVEGKKSIREFLNSNIQLEKLFTVEDCFEAPQEKMQIISEADLHKISQLRTSQTALALFKIPEVGKPKIEGLKVALDGIRDPGNLGTIIRLCDWFGITTLLCSKDTTDAYNPKVVQASMGSLARVEVAYLNINDLLEAAKGFPVIGSFMEGENVYLSNLPTEGILVMGNEANGISQELQSLITNKIGIPQFGKSGKTESLNVATATAILLSEFKRRSFTGM